MAEPLSFQRPPHGETSPPAPAPASKLSHAALLALAWVPFLLFAASAIAPPLNHDVSAVLAFTQRWVAGEPLYSRLVDVNPPLIFVLNLPAAWLAHWLPLPGWQALHLCFGAWIGLSCWLCWRIRRGTQPARAEGPAEAYGLDLGLPLLMVAAGFDFGQREHLMLIASLPYLLLRARQMEAVGIDAAGPAIPRRLRLSIALFAAIGFALKPHFLAIPALVEAAVLLHRLVATHRQGRVLLLPALADLVPWAMAAFWLLYLASIPLFFPAYFSTEIPLIWQDYVGLGGTDWRNVLFTERFGTATLALLPGLLLAFWPAGAAPPPRHLARLFALAGLGALAAAWVQHKGWSYHVLPLRLLACGTALSLALPWLDKLLRQASPPGPALPAPQAPPPTAAQAAPPIAMRSTGLAIACAATWLVGSLNLAGAEAPWRELHFDDSEVGHLAAALRQQAPGGRVLILSPDILPAYPATLYAGETSTFRFMSAWLLQAMYTPCPADGGRYHPPASMSPAEAFLFHSTVDDFVAKPPEAILVDKNSGIWCGGGFDFLDYFGQAPLFAAAFRHYREAGPQVLAGADRFRLFLRTDQKIEKKKD